jgi:K+-sensing histidine kinase KdpD
MTRRLDRLFHRLDVLLTFGVGHRPERVEPAAVRPGDAVARRRRGAIPAIAVAVLVPIAFGVVLIPFRDWLEQSVSLLMVVPVLVLAAVGGARLGAVSAVAAAAAFGALHTEPYYEVTIDDADDIVEMIVLLVIGVVSGLVMEAAQRSVVSSRVRERELRAMTAFLDRIGASDPTELIAQAQRSIEQLLVADSSTWRPGYRGTAAPVLTPAGMIAPSGYTGSPSITSTRLPREVEIPVGTPPHEHGRLVVRASAAHVSVEERRAAATIATALGRCLRST